jgi:hypothetical protein
MANQLALNPYDKLLNEFNDPNKKVDLRPEMSEFGKGVRAFGDESQAIGGGLLALGAQHLKSITPDSFGEKVLDPVSKYGLKTYKENIEEATAGRQAPKVSRFEDIGETGTVGDFVGYQLGKGLPNLAALGVGSIVGRGIAKAGIKAGTKDILKTKVGKNLVGRKVTQEVKDKATAEVRKTLTRGEIAGGFATGAGYEGGAAFGETIEEGVDPERAKWAATGIGGLSGALEFLPLYKVAKNLGAGDVAKNSIREIIKNDKALRNMAKELAGRATKAGTLGAGVEGLTEGMQQLVNIAGIRWAKEDPMFADLDENDWSAVQNAMITGGLVGGTAAGGLGVLAGPKQEAKPDVDPTQVVDKKPEEVISLQEPVAEVIAPEVAEDVAPIIEPIVEQLEPVSKLAETDVEVGKNKQGNPIYQDVEDYQYVMDKGKPVYLDDTNTDLFEKQEKAKEEVTTYGQDVKGETVQKKEEITPETKSKLEVERKGQGSFAEETIPQVDTEVFKSPRAAEAAIGREGLVNAEVVKKDIGWVIKTTPEKQAGLNLTEEQAVDQGLVDNPNWFKDSEGLWQEKQVKDIELDLDSLPEVDSKTQSRFEGQDINLVEKSSDQMREEARKFIDPKTVDKLEQSGILNFTNEASADGAQGEFNVTDGVFNVYGGSQVEGDNVASVILHESSHSGLDRLLGGKLEGFTKDILKQAEAGNKVAQAAKEKLFGKEKVPDKLDFVGKEELAAWYIQLSQESNQQSGLSRRMTDTLKAKFRESKIGRAARAVGIDFQLTPELAVEYAHMAVGNSLNLAKELDRLGAPRVGSKIEQDIQVKEGVNKTEVKTLSDVLESNILFDNNPELKDQKVEFKYMGLDKAHTQGDTIYLSSEFNNTNIASLKPTLFRELDWLAQDKEGWRGFTVPVNLIDYPILNQARKLAKTISDVNTQGMSVLRETEQLVSDPEKAIEIERLLYRGLPEGLEGRVSKQLIDFMGVDPKLFSRAYHGTAHEVDKFLTERIGTGEGASAQGYGLYMADDKGVGQWYRDKLKEEGTEGNLYEVDLKPEVNQYLDWDKPLTQQSDYVKDAIINAGMGSYITDEMTGNKFYNELAKFYIDKDSTAWFVNKADSQRQVSNELLGMGIRGNKYLDSSSRGTDKGNYNYVIFDEDDVEIVTKLQSNVTMPIFYSELTKQVEDIKQPKAPAKQWMAMLKKLTQKGVKGEELKWSGVEEWLEERKGSVSKDELLGYLKEQEVRLEDVTLGENIATWDSADTKEFRVQLTSVDYLGFDTIQQAKNAINENEDWVKLWDVQDNSRLIELGTKYRDYVRRKKDNKPKFESYQMGGEKKDYRELLIKLPGKTPPMTEERWTELNNRIDALTESEQTEIEAEVEREETGTAILVGEFTSAHFNESNIVAHTRFNEREIGGKKTLFLEEIQSDWHQEGRKRGYKTDKQKPVIDFKLDKLVNELTILDQRYNDIVAEMDEKNLKIVGSSLGDELNNTARKTDEVIEAINKQFKEQLIDNDIKGFSLLFSADGWVIVQDHQDGGATTVATGESPQEVYDKFEPNKYITDQVPDVPFKATPAWATLAFKRMLRHAVDNGFEQIAWTPGEVQNERYDLSKQVKELDIYRKENGTYYIIGSPLGGETNIDIADDINESKLAEYIGKDLAKKVIQNKDNSQTYSDLDLKVGGEGMKGFYDKILPKAVGKFVKKFGGKVETKENQEGEEVWSVEITSEMEEVVPKGLSLFSKAGDIKGDLSNLADNLYIGKQPQVLESSIADTFADFRRRVVADVNNPREQYELGAFQTWYVKFVDSFATIEKKDEGIKDVFDLAESKRTTKIDEINRRFTEPLVKLIDESGIKLEEVNDWIAARSIFLDNANLDMAERASHEFINRLLPRLTKEKQDEVREKRDQILEGKDNKEAQIQMYALMEEYLQHERIEEGDEVGISGEWQLFKQHSSGMFIKGEGLVNTANAPDAEEIYNRHLNNTKLEEIAGMFDQLTKHQLDLLEEGGNITEAERLAMIKDKPHYAPLRREAFDYEKTFDFLNKKGFGPSKGVSVRYGSANASKPVHTIQNALARAHGSAATAQKNLANNFLYDQIIENKSNWKEWFIVGNDTTQAATDKLGFVKKKKTSNLDPTDIRLIRKGKRLIISPIEQNERATVFASAVNKLGAQEYGSVAKVFGWVNSIVRFTAVSASPAFLMANLIRDPLTAVYNMQASEAESHTKEIIGSYGKTFKALMDVYWKGNRDPENPNVQMVERWEKAGGRISFVESLREMDTSVKSFDTKVKVEGTPGVKQVFKMVEGIEKANIIVENIMRLATFEALYQEVGDVKAARIAKDLTTNFTRKGFNSSSMGMFYLFFNATVQGNAQVIKNMVKSKKLVGMVAGTIAMAAIFDSIGRAIGDDDEEGVSDWDKIPMYEKERNIILPIKIGGEYVKIPAPWVYNVVWRLGGMLSENGAGIRTATDTGVDTVTMLLNTFNPLGGGSFAQGISPTALDPIIQVVENKNFAGNPLRPINFPGAGSKPEAELAWRNTPEIYKDLSRTLNEVTGGDVAHSGWADISPSTFQNTVNFFGAGLLKFMTNVGKLPSTLSEDEIETKNVPILRQFAAVPSERVSTQKYYDRVAEVTSAEKAIKDYGRGETKDLNKQKEAKVKYREVLRMSSQVKDTERQLRSLRTRLGAARSRGDERVEKELEKRIASVRRRFNMVWSRRVKD